MKNKQPRRIRSKPKKAGSRRRVKGSGDYEVNPTINTIAKGLGGLATNLMGMGTDVGSQLGDKAHRIFKTITGYGDYKVKNNTLVTDTGVPMFKPNDRILTVRHREFVKDIYSLRDTLGPGETTKFSSSKYNINPCNASLFPWLSALAKNYQQYRFKGLLFAFESKCGNAISSTNNTLGTVIMATDYIVKEKYVNKEAFPFKNKQEMEAHEFCTSSVPSNNMIHPIECARSEQLLDHFNCLNHPLDSEDDVKFFFPGTFQISTIGMQAAGVNLGELWVTYDVELLKPRKQDTQASYHGQFTGNAVGSYLPPVQVVKYNSPGFVNIDPLTGLVIIDPGYYGPLNVTTIFKSPAGAIINGLVFTPSSTITSVKTYLLDTVSSVTVGTATDQMSEWQFYVNGGGTLQISINTVGADVDCKADVFIDAEVDDVNF